MSTPCSTHAQYLRLRLYVPSDEMTPQIACQETDLGNTPMPTDSNSDITHGRHESALPCEGGHPDQSPSWHRNAHKCPDGTAYTSHLGTAAQSHIAEPESLRATTKRAPPSAFFF